MPSGFLSRPNKAFSSSFIFGGPLQSAGVFAAQKFQRQPSSPQPTPKQIGAARQPKRDVASIGMAMAPRKWNRIPMCGMRSASAREGPCGIQAASMGARPGMSGPCSTPSPPMHAHIR